MTAREATSAALHLLMAMVILTAGQYHYSTFVLRPLTSRSGPPKNDRGPPQDDGAVNPGSNLFVTGIHPKLSEHEVTLLFEKYGDVEKCQIMLDPHSKESRGFGFVKMVTADQADAAKEGLQGDVIEGRTLSIEKARRSRPRTPTPGKYFGPPKRG
jgi:transformer-2 protein